MPPLTSKGTKILHAMTEKYGEKKGKEVFYASANAGKITGVHDRHKALDAQRPSDLLNRAVKAGMAEQEAQRQAQTLLGGRYVTGADRGKLKGRR
jgi:hypothetical protein